MMNQPSAPASPESQNETTVAVRRLPFSQSLPYQIDTATKFVWALWGWSIAGMIAMFALAWAIQSSSMFALAWAIQSSSISTLLCSVGIFLTVCSVCLLPFLVLFGIARSFMSIPAIGKSGFSMQVMKTEKELPVCQSRHGKIDLLGRLLTDTMALQREAATQYYRHLLELSQADSYEVPAFLSQYWGVRTKLGDTKLSEIEGWVMVTPDHILFDSNSSWAPLSITASIPLSRVTEILVSQGGWWKPDTLIIRFFQGVTVEEFELFPRLSSHLGDTNGPIKMCLRYLLENSTLDPSIFADGTARAYLGKTDLTPLVLPESP